MNERTRLSQWFLRINFYVLIRCSPPTSHSSFPSYMNVKRNTSPSYNCHLVGMPSNDIKTQNAFLAYQVFFVSFCFVFIISCCGQVVLNIVSMNVSGINGNEWITKPEFYEWEFLMDISIVRWTISFSGIFLLWKYRNCIRLWFLFLNMRYVEECWIFRRKISFS